MRSIALSLALVAGCASLPDDGALMCGPDPAHQCPEGFHCAVHNAMDNRFCYLNGHDPDLAMASADDMAGASTDMAGADLSPPPPDMVATDLAQNITALTWTDTSASIPAGAMLSTVYALSDTDVYFGEFGTEIVRHWDGNATWTAPLNTGVTNSIGGLWAFSTSDVYAISSSGVFHYNGATFTKVYPASGISTPSAIWGLSAAFVRVVGNNNLSLLSTNGGTSFAATDTYSGALTAIWGVSTTEMYLGALNGDIAHEGGSAGGAGFVKETNVNSVNISRIWGTGAGSVWAIGSAGTVMHSSGNGQWQPAGLGVPGTSNMISIWGPSADDLFLGGTAGTFLQSTNNGLSWVPVSGANLPTDGQVMGVWGSSKTDVWVLYRATANGPKIFHGH